ncbi:hypothetical protein AGABI2DRAFT_194749 [Agaricus bisporus var. bisporus H97]|uniref:hypothetical protein n=1 Tax=Agaricus bisporus var. bisporus (strain H97 / ATCC MYA-4626 / FGSC 10389) TaxID=936046 RepID=UPI00029F7CCA|nr:hypothetical protein AGABI2DRAFT_194749 [Agaricus bisporus var. bisporus H97]EKV43782.1 hypothetical protein AGABI2DRAFT_194749 [Agaricus bisporus var. bisporus H97]
MTMAVQFRSKKWGSIEQFACEIETEGMIINLEANAHMSFGHLQTICTPSVIFLQSFYCVLFASGW